MRQQVIGTRNSKIWPCLRWAGSKRRHIGAIREVLPRHFDVYYEPMFGSGAVYLHIAPSRAVVGDSSRELIQFYQVLRDRTEELISRLKCLKACRQTYYTLRASEPSDPFDAAVRFAYLNRLCWNGLYRVNRHGNFNVPIGSRLPDSMWDFENLRRIASLLSTATLFWGDFSECVMGASEGDLVYLDPPYPRGSTNGLGFDRYTSERFSFDEHARLARTAVELSARGVFVLVSEAADPEILQLFPRHFVCKYVNGRSLISGRTSGRRPVREALLFNYSQG